MLVRRERRGLEPAIAVVTVVAGAAVGGSAPLSVDAPAAARAIVCAWAAGPRVGEMTGALRWELHEATFSGG